MTEPGRLFSAVDECLLTDRAPSRALSKLEEEGEFKGFPFSMLERLKAAPQSPQHHPEGNVWNHTLLVVDAAAEMKDKSCDKQVFMWAALLHDIGKPGTTKSQKGRITAYNHEKLGAVLARQFLVSLSRPEDFIDRVTALVRWHMQILYVVKSLPFADVKAMKAEVKAQEVALLGLCDRLGRLGADFGAEKKNIEIFLQKVKE